jgi:hypothetical protein
MGVRVISDAVAVKSTTKLVQCSISRNAIPRKAKVKNTKGHWWVEVNPVTRTPFTPCKAPVCSLQKPIGNFVGSFHCKECAEMCVSYGLTELGAWDFNHGTDDERFYVFFRA